MSGEPPDDESPELLKGPAMDSSGKLEGRPKLRVVGRPQDDLDLAHAPTGNVREGARNRAGGITPLAEDPLELQERDRGGGSFYKKPGINWVRPLLKLLTVLFVLAALAGVAWMFRSDLRAEIPMLRPKATALVFLSEPDGATVKVGTRVLGKTPVTVQNHWAEGTDVPVEMTLPGYKPWKGSIRGGQDATVEGTLQRGR